MSTGKSYFDQPEDGGRLARKAKDSPFVIVGMAGFVAAIAIGAYKFKHRGSMSTSVFLMQLRVAAQGTVVACLTAGLGYNMYNQYFAKSTKEE